MTDFAMPLTDVKAEYERYELQYYSQKEEIANAITHGIGVVLAFIGLGFMLAISDNWLEYLCSVLYFLPCLSVYGNSTIYHALTNLKIKSAWRKIDHANIGFIVIACSTPICLLISTNTYNYVALGLSFAVAIQNAVLCSVNLMKFKKWAVFCDFVIGAFMTVVVIVNFALIAAEVKILFLTGVLTCCFGAILYGIKKPYIHAIFHVFELVGTVIFYFAGILLF